VFILQLDSFISSTVQFFVNWTYDWFYITKFQWQKSVLLLLGVCCISLAATHTVHNTKGSAASIALVLLTCIFLWVIKKASKEIQKISDTYRDDNIYIKQEESRDDKIFRLITTIFFISFAAALHSVLLIISTLLYVAGEYLYTCVPRDLSEKLD
jgi:uncharacterized membrane protein